MLGSVAFIVLSLAPLLVPPQSAEDIVRAAAWRHAFPITATTDTVTIVSGVRSETFQGQAITIEYTRITKGEDMFREEERTKIGGQVYRMETLFDGHAGWGRVTDGVEEKTREMTAQKVRECQQRKSIRAITSPEQVLRNKDIQLERLKDGTVGNAKVYVVRITSNGTELSNLYIDQKSLLVIKVTLCQTDSDGKRHVAEQSYSDFRRIGHYMIGMKVELRVDGKVEMTDMIKSVEFKSAKDYPDSMFRKPKQ